MVKFGATLTTDDMPSGGGTFGLVAYARLTTDTANLTQGQIVTDMNITFTAVATRAYLITALVHHVVSNGANANNYAYLGVTEAGSGNTVINPLTGSKTSLIPASASFDQGVCGQALWLPSAGSMTLRLSVYVAVQTGTTFLLTATATLPRVFMVQDIGPR